MPLRKLINSIEQTDEKYIALGIFLISTVFFLSRLYEPSLSGDAAKYGLIAKTMLKSGEYLTPSLVIDEYYKKPPFFFWIIAFFFKIFGVNEFSARLPSAIFAILDTLLLFKISKDISKSNRIALLTSLAFIINFEVIRISTTVRFESFLLFVNLTSIVLLQKPSLVKGIALGFLIGAGLLTKGPFSLLGVTAVLITSLLTKDFKSFKYALAALVFGLIIFGTYLLYMWQRYPQFLSEFFGNQILGRFTGILNEGTPRPFYFYERIILKHFWIWNVFLLIGLYKILRKEILFNIKNKRLWLSFLTMFLITYIPLHFVSLKFTRYSYYLYPFLAFFVANTASKGKFFKWSIFYSLSISTLYCLVALSCPCTFHKDKLKDIRPIVEVGLKNFQHLGIDKSIDRLKAYALLFYFDELDVENPKFLLGRCNDRKDVLIKYDKYCIFRKIER